AAGLHRLGRAEEMAFPIEPGELVPAAGAGGHADGAPPSPHPPPAGAPATTAPESIPARGSLAPLLAERAVVAALDATCNTPLGVTAALQAGGRIRIQAFCGLPDGSEWLRDEIEEDDADPEAAGRALAERLRSAGAANILERAEKMAAA